MKAISLFIDFHELIVSIKHSQNVALYSMKMDQNEIGMDSYFASSKVRSRCISKRDDLIFDNAFFNAILFTKAS